MASPSVDLVRSIYAAIGRGDGGFEIHDGKVTRIIFYFDRDRPSLSAGWLGATPRTRSRFRVAGQSKRADGIRRRSTLDEHRSSVLLRARRSLSPAKAAEQMPTTWALPSITLERAGARTHYIS
jgi:hypothetical protein